MKKVLFFLPAILYTIAVIALNIILRTSSPLWYSWVILMWLGGVLLNRGKVWGGILILLPAIMILYMSTQTTGQVVNEAPLGIITVVYAFVCMYVACKNGSNR